jgi:hypothetical protein
MLSFPLLFYPSALADNQSKGESTMKKIRVIDVVARSLNHTTAVVLITTFGCDNQVMVFNASTNQLIATVRSIGNGVYSINNDSYTQTRELAPTLTDMPGFPRGASKSRNYSRPVTT